MSNPIEIKNIPFLRLYYNRSEDIPLIWCLDFGQDHNEEILVKSITIKDGVKVYSDFNINLNPSGWFYVEDVNLKLDGGWAFVTKSTS